MIIRYYLTYWARILVRVMQLFLLIIVPQTEATVELRTARQDLFAAITNKTDTYALDLGLIVKAFSCLLVSLLHRRQFAIGYLFCLLVTIYNLVLRY